MTDNTEQDDKTEDPTERRLRQAREQGDVAKSQDLGAFGVLIGGLGGLAIAGPALGRGLLREFQIYLEQPHAFATDPAALQGLAWHSAGDMAQVSLWALGAIALGALIGQLAQHAPLWTAARIKPDLSKLDPIKGFGRIFGRAAFIQWLKNVAKLTIVGLAGGLSAWNSARQLPATTALSPAALMDYVLDIGLAMAAAMLVMVAVFAAIDYILQRQEFLRRNRMTRQQLRDEFKDTEGDPHVRARLRQIRAERSRRRMLAAVPQAAVVITNPTHYAIALKYERGKTPAPICVAKGVDAVALRIRAIAEENNVPIVEDPPLARALHASAELDEPIPLEHYQAVAKVIGFVLRLADRRSPRTPNAPRN